MMRSKFLAVFAEFFLALALLVPVAALPGAQAPPSQPPQTAPAKRERHPAIRQAIHLLQRAKQVLQKEAARDFEGHRANAVKDIDAALAELHKALRADRQ